MYFYNRHDWIDRCVHRIDQKYNEPKPRINRQSREELAMEFMDYCFGNTNEHADVSSVSWVFKNNIKDFKETFVRASTYYSTLQHLEEIEMVVSRIVDNGIREKPYREVFNMLCGVNVAASLF